MDPAQIQMEATWKEMLADEFRKPYFDGIKQALIRAKKQGKSIYPPGPKIFNAYNSTPFDSVKVVILGQDPYHGPGQAMGLCFSVPKGVKVPASLKNIYKEMAADVGIEIPQHGDLTNWTKQGVFMLNSVLTVAHKSPGSHRKIGWQTFTDRTISLLSEHREGLVFLLWGNYAKSKIPLIDEFKHYIFSSPHPSPLAGGGFFGNHHFSRTNEILRKAGQEPINWQV